MPLIKYPNYLTLCMFTDASLFAVEFELSENNEDGSDYPIAYFFQNLTKHKRNYTVS